MKGLDVSNNQGSIDFNSIKAAGYDIVYIKATEGMTYNDSYMLQNYARAKASGLLVGMYHYLRNNDPVAEAKHYLSTIVGLAPDCIHMIDAEDACLRGIASSSIRRFADTLISAGLKVGLYTYTDFFNNLDSSVKDLPLWIASWSAVEPEVNHVGWQFTSKSRVAGVDGNVDEDIFTDGILIKPVTITTLINTNPQQANIPGQCIVQPGDTLSGIAAKYGLRYQDIAAWNNISDPNKIMAGTCLDLKPATTPTGRTYVIQSGDNLSSIAAKFGTTYQSLANINNIINPDKIFAGQVLKLDGASQNVASTHTYYTVVAGDTLSGIASKFGVHYLDVAAMNGISNPNKIYAGQKLIIK